MHETPDIEIVADEMEEQMKVTAEVNAEEARYAGVNSCDALRIIDGVIPDPTVVTATNDKVKIRGAFKVLRQKGYFCRMRFLCCQGCGWAAVPEGKGDKVVFYHAQDADSLDEDGNIEEGATLFLAWAGDGTEIVHTMQSAGLTVEWDGSANTRIGLIHKAA